MKPNDWEACRRSWNYLVVSWEKNKSFAINLRAISTGRFDRWFSQGYEIRFSWRKVTDTDNTYWKYQWVIILIFVSNSDKSNFNWWAIPRRVCPPKIAFLSLSHTPLSPLSLSLLSYWSLSNISYVIDYPPLPSYSSNRTERESRAFTHYSWEENFYHFFE